LQEPGGGFKLLTEVQGFLEPMYDMSKIVVTRNYLGSCAMIYGAVESTKREIERNVQALLDPGGLRHCDGGTTSHINAHMMARHYWT
jgi:hypothetical protein